MTYTVLVIDSTKTQRDLLCDVLRVRLHYHTIGVSSVAEASAYLTNGQTPKPDVVLFDIPSPRECETLNQLKAMAGYTPIITLVKYADYETSTMALNTGAFDFLTKPVATERLHTTLRNSLLLRDARRDLEWFKHEQRGGAGGNGRPGNALSFSLIGEDGNIRHMILLKPKRFAMLCSITTDG